MSLASISLFTGAGGLDLGLEAAGFCAAVAVEMNEDAVQTLRLNRDWQVLDQPIGELSTRRLLQEAGLGKGEAAVLAGGPPCQPFSKSANWRNPHGDARGLDDVRSDTIAQYLRVLREAKPKAFILENVFGLAYRVNQKAMRLLERGIREAGYVCSSRVLNAADYGVPQIRERFFIVGMRDDLAKSPPAFPLPTHASPDRDGPLLGLPVYVSAKEAFDGVPPSEEGKELEVRGKYGHLLPLVPPGDNYLFFTAHRGHPSPLFKWRGRYWSFLLKLHPNRPSWTIQASPGPYIGPFHWKNRRLTIAELKRIQTFPDDYQLVGSRMSVQKQIGNAVPCRLAERLGASIRKQLARCV